MALVLKDRVQETSTTTGTGTLTLAGAVTQFQTFSSAIGNGNTTYYTIYNSGGSLWEVGIGTVGAGTLSRDTVLASSNAGAAVSFTGTLYVFCDYPATKSVYQDAIGTTTVGQLATSSTTSTTPVLSFNASNSNYAAGATISGSYLQTVLQNKSGTAGASTNFVLSNDLGTDSTYYGEFGMNSSVYSTGTPADFFSLNNGIYYSGHDGPITVGSGNGQNLYLSWGTTGQSAHVINVTGAIGLNTSITGSTNFGTNGQVLTSNGSAATPTWTTPTTGTVTSVTGTAPVVSSGGNTPAISMAAANGTTNGYLTSTDWTTFNGKGAGTVTSVAQSFTGGIISVGGSPITTSGTLALTVAGTSGGIPYFSSGTAWASSAALAANAIVIGGGAGVAPATTTTGTGVVTALGVNTGTTGAFVVNGGVLGTPSSGTVTNLTGTASININGTVGATTANTGAFTTVSATGVITSTVATGTAPFTVASTTQVANLNAATAGTATSATSATNLAGGAVGYLPYQSAAATTLFVTGNTTTTPQFLTSTGTGTVAQAPTLTSSTGSGSVVLATSPTLVTPALGTPSAIVLTNASGTASININGTVGATTASTGAFTTLSANSTVTFSGTTTNIAATSQTSGTITIGGTAGTGALTFGSSTASQTTNLANGVTATGNTNTIAIGKNGASGSTTAITIGSSAGTSSTTLQGSLIASSLTGILVGNGASAITTITTGTGVSTALGVAINTTGGFDTIDGTATLTNKRVTPRATTTSASSATPTLNTDNTDIFVITGQGNDITSFTTNLSGTPTNGQKLWISITSTLVINITWGASFESSTVALPVKTVSGTRLDVGFVWNVANSAWRCVAVA